MSKQELLLDRARAKGGFICLCTGTQSLVFEWKAFPPCPMSSFLAFFPSGMAWIYGPAMAIPLRKDHIAMGLSASWNALIIQNLWYEANWKAMLLGWVGKKSHWNGKLPRRKHWFSFSWFFFLQYLETDLIFLMLDSEAVECCQWEPRACAQSQSCLLPALHLKGPSSRVRPPCLFCKMGIWLPSLSLAGWS